MFTSARFVRGVVRPLHCPLVHRGLAYNYKNFTYVEFFVPNLDQSA